MFSLLSNDLIMSKRKRKKRLHIDNWILSNTVEKIHSKISRKQHSPTALSYKHHLDFSCETVNT